MNLNQVTFTLSIIIPCYNIENCIQDTLYSLYLQNNSEVEIIIINDGSTDNTLSKIYSFTEKYYIQNIEILDVENGGLSKARNLGLEMAKGDFIWYLDGDDALNMGAIDCLLRIIEENKNVEIIKFQGFDFEDKVLGCKPVNYSGNNEWLIQSYNHGKQQNQIADSKEYLFETIRSNSFLSNVCFYIQKRSFLKINRIDSKVGIVFEDVLYTTKLFLRNCKILFIEDRLILHRRRIGSIMRSSFGYLHILSGYKVANGLLKMNFLNSGKNELFEHCRFYFYLALRRTRDNEFGLFGFILRFPFLFLILNADSNFIRTETFKNIKFSIKKLLGKNK
jgi:glycosyltransferase involved in cell wall biosynthesis